MDESELRELYLRKKLSTKQIADETGLTIFKVDYWLAKHGIKKRTISEATYAHKNPSGDPFRYRPPLTLEEGINFGIGIGLFWGEGNKADKHAVRIGNTDPGVIISFIEFLEDFYTIDRSKLRFSLQIFSDTDPETAKSFWIERLRVSPAQFYKTTVTLSGKIGTYRKKNQTGVLTLYFHNRKLRDILIEQLELMPR